MKKQLVAILAVLMVLVGVIAITSADVQAEGSAINLLYDDRKDLSDLIGKSASQVTITNEVVTSNAVGSTQKDAHVLQYENGTLYAVGVGTATVMVDGTAYAVTVEAAPISLFMITGHSVGAGQEGTATQSVAVEAGQAYSSHYYKSLDTTKVDGYGLGYGSANRAGNAESNRNDSLGILDAFVAGQGGTVGTGSALAYQWNKRTGEKIWVLNAAVPGSCINEWQPDHPGHHTSGAYAYPYYDNAVAMYQCAQQILKNEIAAGHYTLSHMGIVYFSGANFSNASYTDWTLDSLKGHYTTMWNGFKSEFALDMDGDGSAETVESLGIVPIWTQSNATFGYDKATNYYMAASQEWPDVYILSDVYRNWITDDGLSSFPAIDYATNSGETVQKPASVLHTNKGGSSVWSVFCAADVTHLSQVTYNAVGFDMGENLYQHFYNDSKATAGRFENTSGKDLAAVTVRPNEQLSVVPVVTPLYGKKVTLAASGQVMLNGNCIQAKDAGTGTVTLSIDGQVVDTLTVTVKEHQDHCACGGHAKGMKNHTCKTLTGWQAWGDTAAEKTKLPTSAGNYYLVSDITLSASQKLYGTINLCLNGYNITGSSRPVNLYGTLHLTDCNQQSNWGTMSSSNSGNYGGLFYTYEATSQLNVYAGNYDADGNNVMGGILCLYKGSANIYGGNFDGATCVRREKVNDATKDGQGGVLHIMSNTTCNIYGGKFFGGKAQNAGGNICVNAKGTLNLYGGTVSGGTVDPSCGTVAGGIGPQGGNIMVFGTLNMYGGTVETGSAENGGNIFNSGSVTISGGTVKNGTADISGGNIYQNNAANSLLTISGGTISGGKTAAFAATNKGGNLYIHGENDGALGQVQITGGTVTGGKANLGGNIYVAGTLGISGGTITKGVASGSSNCGGNIYLASIRNTTTKQTTASVSMSAGTVSDGNATYGGNIQAHAAFTMTGGTISGGKATNGGSIRVFRPGVFTLDGGMIEGGTATKDGGVFQLSGSTATNTYSQVATLNIISGEIRGGSADRGATIFMQFFTVLNMQGGTVVGGTATTQGGALCIYNNQADRSVEAHISGGEIQNGTAPLGQGIHISCTAGAQLPQLTISKDAVLSGEGANLYVDNTQPIPVRLEQLSGKDSVFVADVADKTVAFATADADYSANILCADPLYKTEYADGQLIFQEDKEEKLFAVYEGQEELAKYANLEDAVAAAHNGYIKLLTDVQEDYELTGEAWIDLNGFDLSGVTVSGTLYCMDSATVKYDDTNAGTLTATVAEGGKIVSHFATEKDRFGAVQRYMVIPGADNTYTSHRFYVGITKVTLDPSCYAVGYTAEFYGDAAVKAQLAPENTYGYGLWVEGYQKHTYSYNADRLDEKPVVTLRVKNFLDPAKDEDFNRARAEMRVNAYAFLTLANGEVIEAELQSYNFREVVEQAAIRYESFSEAKQALLDQVARDFGYMMFTWAAPVLHHKDEGWTAWSDTTKLPTTTGKYYLTADVTPTATGKIAPDQEVTLCLNGHTVKGAVRFYYISGTLNICDCCSKKEPQEQGYMIGQSTGTMGPILYTYHGATVNLYSGNLTSDKSYTQGGILVLGGDTGRYENENDHLHVFNMYGGKLYGGNATEKGGIISTVRGGEINIYGGEIRDGSTGGKGGAIYLKGSAADNIVLNMYGGTISGSTAAGDGGNIYAETTAQVNIFGGTIENGKAMGNGGNIAVAGNHLNITDGLITGGSANAAGNIYIAATASTNIVLDGGTITGGRAETHGGNLYLVNDGNYTFNNVTISDGYAAGDGGNLYLFTDMIRTRTTEEEFDILLHNCTITGGTAGDKGDSLYVMEVDLTISGSTLIQNANGESLYLGAGETVLLKDLTQEAKIYTSMSIPGTVSYDTAYLDNVYADDSSMDVQIVNGGIKLIDQATSAQVPDLNSFSVGWYRGDVTPTEPVPLDGYGNDYGRMDKWEIKTPLLAGVTVIADETGIENGIILINVDTLFIQKEVGDNLAQAISDATGVAANRIFVSATHSHSAVSQDEPYEPTRNYLENFYENVTAYAVKAVEDLAPAVIKTASIDVVDIYGNSFNLSRRYIGLDGNAYSQVDSNRTDPAIPAEDQREPESGSDPQMQLIQFQREDKTDVVLANWQSHPSGWGSATYGRVSAENWYYFRQYVEESLGDAACTFLLGAAGNVGLNSTDLRANFHAVDGNIYQGYVSGSTQKTIENNGKTLSAYAVYALKNNAKIVQPGALQVANYTFETEDLYYAKPSGEKYKEDYTEYQAIDMDLNAIAIGDEIAFITAPYEMFHENGQQIKDYAADLGFSTCFVVTNSMGENKYIASNNAFENDTTDGYLSSFGVRTGRFLQGTAEKLIDEYADLLAGLKGIAPMDTIYTTYTVHVVDQNGNPVQNVMVELVGNGDTRNCSNADGTVCYMAYSGGDYGINVVRTPEGYTYNGTAVSFDQDRTVTITVTAQ